MMHHQPEAWTLIDRPTGRKLGSKSYPTPDAALDVRRKLIELAATVSATARADVVERCDVRKER